MIYLLCNNVKKEANAARKLWTRRLIYFNPIHSSPTYFYLIQSISRLLQSNLIQSISDLFQSNPFIFDPIQSKSMCFNLLQSNLIQSISRLLQSLAQSKLTSLREQNEFLCRSYEIKCKALLSGLSKKVYSVSLFDFLMH